MIGISNCHRVNSKASQKRPPRLPKHTNQTERPATAQLGVQRTTRIRSQAANMRAFDFRDHPTRSFKTETPAIQITIGVGNIVAARHVGAQCSPNDEMTTAPAQAARLRRAFLIGAMPKHSCLRRSAADPLRFQMRCRSARKIEHHFIDVTAAPAFRRIIGLDDRVQLGERRHRELVSILDPEVGTHALS
jgi:hypothetical protein